MSTGRLDGSGNSSDLHVIFKFPVGQPCHCHVQVQDLSGNFNTLLQLQCLYNALFCQMFHLRQI